MISKIDVESLLIGELIEDDQEITAGYVSVCKLKKDPNTGWLLNENVYQVTFYDPFEDFEVSNIYESAEDAILMFMEIRNITTILTKDGFRIKSPKAQYDKIFSFQPSSYGEVGKRRLLTKKKNK